MAGAGRRRVARLGLAADRPVVPRWPAPLLALLAVVACGAGGANTGLLAILAAQLGFLLAAAIFLSARLPRLSIAAVAPVLAGLLGFLAWAALPGLQAAGGGPALLAPDRFWPAWLEDASMVALFLSAAIAGLRRGNGERFAIWLTIFAAVLIAATLALRLAGPAVDWPWPMEDERLHRFAGSIGNPNAAGVIYAMLGLIALAVARLGFARWRLKPGDRRLLAALAGLAVALVGFALVGITQSRTALALLAAGLALQLATGTPARKSRRGWRVAGIVAAVLALMVAAAGTLDRFAPMEADGVGRWAIWRYYLALAGKAPLIGHGLGAFVELNQRQLTPASAPALWSFGAAHAAPVQLALETGWPGLGLLAAVVALVLARIIRRLRPAADPVGLAMVLAVLVAVLAGMVDIALNVPGVAMLVSIVAGLSWGRAVRGHGWREGL